MPTAKKVDTVEEITNNINAAKSVFLTDFIGLNVAEISELRRSFRAQEVKYQVVKNTLARLSVKSAGYDQILDCLEGPTAFAYGTVDPAAPARVIKEFTKKIDKLKIKGCIFEGVLIDVNRANELANLPTQQVLLAQIMGALKSPISNLVYSLGGMLSKLVYALDSLKKQKEQQ